VLSSISSPFSRERIHPVEYKHLFHGVKVRVNEIRKETV